MNLPLATRVGGHKDQGLQPLVQRLKAQLQRNLFEHGRQQSVGLFKLAGADQDFDQVEARIVVPRVRGQSIFQLGLRGLQVARRHQLFSRLGFAFGQQGLFARNVFVQKFAQFAFGHGAHKAVHRLAVFQQNAGGNAAHAKGRSQLLLLVGVDFHQFEAPAIGLFRLFQQGAQGFARAAPGGPKVHQHGRGHGGGDHLGFKIFGRDINHGGQYFRWKRVKP